MCEEEAVNWRSKNELLQYKKLNTKSKTRKSERNKRGRGETKEIQDDRGTGMDKKMELVECSRAETSHLWQ